MERTRQCRGIVELGFDVPGHGAMNQPWHRDFPMPEITRREGVLDSLAINVTCVDTEPDMGPFEETSEISADGLRMIVNGTVKIGDSEQTWYEEFDWKGPSPHIG